MLWYYLSDKVKVSTAYSSRKHISTISAQLELSSDSLFDPTTVETSLYRHYRFVVVYHTLFNIYCLT